MTTSKFKRFFVIRPFKISEIIKTDLKMNNIV